MNRRGVLSMLGLGAAAGPALATQYVSTASGAISATDISSKTYLGEKLYDNVPISENPLEMLNTVKDRYNRLTGDKDSWITRYIENEMRDVFRYGNYNNSIDPDIMVMKSFSPSAKMRLHIERRARRRYEEELFDINENLKYWMERVGL
jgi:hypothetical protein